LDTDAPVVMMRGQLLTAELSSGYAATGARAMIPLTCPRCNTVDSVTDDFAGGHTPCRQCGSTIRIPSPPSFPASATLPSSSSVAYVEPLPEPDKVEESPTPSRNGPA